MMMINGLRLITNFVDEACESRLVETLDRQTWDTTLRRRVQHFGYRYDYGKRTIQGLYLGPLPDWLVQVASRVAEQTRVYPTQAIVNEYLAGQGIALHVDCVPCFENVIASVSLLSAVEMCFCRQRDPKQRQLLVLPQRSLLILHGEARYDWKHGIAARKSDSIGGVRVPRSRRVSITFRTVKNRMEP